MKKGSGLMLGTPNSQKVVGSSTVPVRVVSLPAEQVWICRHRFTQLSGKQTLARPAPPQVVPAGQGSVQWRVPPQPSPMSPQYLPSQDSVGAHEAGTHSPLAPQ